MQLPLVLVTVPAVPSGAALCAHRTQYQGHAKHLAQPARSLALRPLTPSLRDGLWRALGQARDACPWQRGTTWRCHDHEH